MDDYINRQTIIDIIHSALYPYFCGAEDGDTLSEDEKLVLSVNKTICTAIKALPSAQPDVPDTTVGDMISRQAAINMLTRESQADGAYGYLDTKSIVDALKRMPSADAVEVVRCKDCTLSEEDVGGWWCIACDVPTEADGYCNNGERKDG